MKILLNAATVKYGGGLTEILNFFNAIRKINNRTNDFIIIAPNIPEYNRFNKYFKIIYVPDKLLKWRNRKYLDKKWVLQIIIQENIDLVFSLGNLPVPISNIKQVLFFDNSFLTADNMTELGFSTKELFIHNLRKRYFVKRLKFVDLIFVQTNIQKNKIRRLSKSNISISIMENAMTDFSGFSHETKNFNFDKSKIKLLVLSRYYPHKNLEILINLAKIIKSKKTDYQIILTIEKKQSPKAEKLLTTINSQNLNNTIINIGNIAYKDIKSLYKQVDALLLPTLLESYSTTYADALGLGVPVFTSDLDFAREVCGDAAFYFNPHDANDIFQVLQKAFTGGNEIKQKIKTGLEITKQKRTWEQITASVIEEIKTL